MLRRLVVRNFRAFTNADLQLAPITIIAGANSSGKTSLLQALNCVLQSRSERSFPFDFVLNGSLAQLGSYRNAVYGHDARHSFGVSVEFSARDVEYEASGTFKDSEEDSRYLFPKSVVCNASKLGRLTLDWNHRRGIFQLRVNENRPAILEDRGRMYEIFTPILRASAEGQSQDLPPSLSGLSIRDAQDVSKLREIVNIGLQQMPSSMSSTSASFDDAIKEFQKHPLFTPIRNELLVALDRQRRETFYLGPVRANPSRYYPVARQSFVLDPFGESMSHMLTFWKERRSQAFNEVKQALVKLELASDISAQVELGEFLKLLIKPSGRLFSDSIADVGFGVSQILPMLVADAALPVGGVLLVNQPEIHLHPSSQALIADYFAERIQKRQYIVETHSEYLINRLRLLVAKGTINESDVKIFYCGALSDGAPKGVTEVRIRKSGVLEGMPKEFFATYAGDAFKLAMSVMEQDDASQ